MWFWHELINQERRQHPLPRGQLIVWHRENYFPWRPHVEGATSFHKLESHITLVSTVVKETEICRSISSSLRQVVDVPASRIDCGGIKGGQGQKGPLQLQGRPFSTLLRVENLESHPRMLRLRCCVIVPISWLLTRLWLKAEMTLSKSPFHPWKSGVNRKLPWNNQITVRDH